jgi:acetyltransferase-like isoleucine patch superfamily enzyme
VTLAPGARLAVRDRLYLSSSFGPAYETNTTAHSRALLRIGAGGALVLDGSASFGAGTKILIDAGGELCIGDGTYVNYNSRIICHESIRIGSACAIAWEVQIMDTDFHTVFIDGAPRPVTAAVTIGDRVWIGSRVTVTKGVTIGDGSVIAAGTVVTRDVPPNSLVAGNPGRVVRENIRWTP